MATISDLRREFWIQELTLTEDEGNRLSNADLERMYLIQELGL